jgi:Tol biopolymer transport system component
MAKTKASFNFEVYVFHKENIMLFKMSRLAFYCGAGLLCLLNGNVFAGQTTQASVYSSVIPLSAKRFGNPSISADGRYVAFASLQFVMNTIPNGTVGIFVRDRLANKTEQIPFNLNSSVDGSNVVFSKNGRYLGFRETPNDTLVSDAKSNYYIYDLLKHKKEFIGDIYGEKISSDGRFISFTDNNGISIYDRLTRKTKNIALKGKEFPIFNLALSSDGRYVVFTSDASMVKEDTNETWDIFVYDLKTDKIERVSVSSDGRQVNGNDIALSANISANGRYVAFLSYSSSLVPKDTNNAMDIFVHDRLLRTTERVSVDSNGKQANKGVSFYFPFQISADGRYVSFASDSSNLVAGDTNKDEDIFIHDRMIHKTERVNISSKGTQGNTGSRELSLSADGRYIAFASDAYNLLNGKDTDGELDIFVRDRLLDTKHHADLTITPTTKPASLKVNTQGAYLYTITNNGKDAVPDVSLIHLVSGGSAVSFKPSQGKCSPSTVETVCHLGKLAAGKKLTLHVMVKAQSKAFSQQVTVSGAPVDIKPINNQISVTTPIK